MTYIEWYKTHGNKHHEIMQKLTKLSDEEVIKYFRFENMLEKEPDFCLLYKENKKCHDIPKLNCYLCACPSFRFDDQGLFMLASKTVYSICDINAKDGSSFESDEAIHQDCTKCLLPHQEGYIKKHFSRDWFEIMKDVYSK